MSHHGALQSSRSLQLQAAAPLAQPPRHGQKSLVPFSTNLSSSKCSAAEPQHLALGRRLSLLCSAKTANSEVISESSLVENKAAIEAEEAALLISSCITKILPPALTLEEGLHSIDQAIQRLKSLGPPSSSNGMLRFQVTVPPSSKSLNWFCCQPESDGVFPQFYMSNEKEDPTYKSMALGRNRGVFGIGSAMYLNCRYANGSENGTPSSQRYIPLESNIPRVYGILDTRFDMTSSAVEQEAGSFHLFIPQIELNEHADTSILVATLAWNESSSFEEAIQTFNLSLDQARQNFWASNEERSKNYISSAARKFNMVEDKSGQMVCLNSLRLRGDLLQVDATELASELFSQFSARFSPTMAIANNMCETDSSTLINYLTNDCPNMNKLWATLVVEECVRLGVTYFCIAPGSRSSPLTIAASSHPLTTCVVCIDERSLAFNALGYARGSHRPAAVITTSGTAVSNLLSAIVEASEDFVPLLYLTADRPPELLDAGANQAIDQVHHFGHFTKHFFGLPVPTDEISARLVLTTLDSAVYLSTTAPYGPIHINCPFREPLGNIPTQWDRKCIKGLENWMRSSEPFTTYTQPPHSILSHQSRGNMVEVVKLVQGAKKGILVLGALHTEDDVWAALLLAKHLGWPVVATILSGLRLRKYMGSFSEIEENIVFLDHLDHVLFSDVVKEWMQADVIIQIGGRVTSKRISDLIDRCSPCSNIMVDKHPMRHDPTHIVTHRIQSSIAEFADSLTKSCIPSDNSKWKAFLRALNMTAAREISSLIGSEQSLTEPYIARIALENLECESAIFLGNSMPIRDADNFGYSWANCNHNTPEMLNSGFQCHGIQVAGNRGTGGIDGLISTATGFAVGCNKQVLLLIGDVSFLYDTNGLSLLKQGVSRKPMVVIVINNQGGAIFSLLPYASSTDQKIMNQFFYTAHTVEIGNLCIAHGVKHVQVKTKEELEEALSTSRENKGDCVIEVKSFIDTNKSFHSHLGKFVRQTVDHSFGVLSKLSVSEKATNEFATMKIAKMEFSRYRIPLLAPPTSSSVGNLSSECYREGFVVSVSLEGGATGFGEVAPMEILKDNLVDVEDQLKFVTQAIKGGEITDFIPLLNGSISSWIKTCLGISPDSLLPSVRCGLEMAILNAIAASKNASLLNILHPRVGELPSENSHVKICGLIDSIGDPTDMASEAKALVDEGFTAIKIKVGRRANPTEDAMVVQEIRRTVGNNVELRVDANRSWTLTDAVEFANLVKNCNLQYIEEPVRDEDDIQKFCEATGLPVALDETFNHTRADPTEVLKKHTHSGVVAVVIKPSMIGGFEKAASVGRWAQKQGKMAVLSSTFESGLGLSSYAQFASYLDLQNAEISKLLNKEPPVSLAHGLGTYKWLKEDVSAEPSEICSISDNGFAGASIVETGKSLQRFKINQNVVSETYSQEPIHEYQLPVDLEGTTYSLNVLETGQQNDGSVLVFLHGFLGSGEDWVPTMKSLSKSARCIAIDLPGHGKSTSKHQSSNGSTKQPRLSVENISGMLCKLFPEITPEKVILVGYSMGARIALHASLKGGNKVEGAVIISGSPGLENPGARLARKVKDDFRASSLVSYGLENFLDTWYSQEMWNSLKNHPHFSKIVSNRLKNGDLNTIAKVLSDSSTGRQQPLWEDLKNCNIPLLLVVGDQDTKFKNIAKDMVQKISSESNASIAEIPHAGHAAHVENPLPVIYAIRKFLNQVKSSPSS